MANPAVDSIGNIYTTFSGSRGQKVPVAVYQIDLNFNMTPFINDLMNATGSRRPRRLLYISSRFDGVVYQVSPSGNMSVYVEGMGVATGIVFDDENNLYVGDRSGTIFKISPQPADFRVRHHRAVHLRLSSGLGAGPASLRQRAHHVELRQHLPGRATTATWRRSIAAWAVRRAWRSTRKATSIRRRLTWGAKAW